MRLLDADRPVRIPVGGTTEVMVGAPIKNPRGEFIFVLSQPPPGITIAKLNEHGRRSGIVLQAGPDAKPGLQDNLIVDVFLESTVQPKKDNPKKNPNPADQPTTKAAGRDAGKNQAQPKPKSPPKKRRIPLGNLPAIPFEVVKE